MIVVIARIVNMLSSYLLLLHSVCVHFPVARRNQKNRNINCLLVETENLVKLLLGWLSDSFMMLLCTKVGIQISFGLLFNARSVFFPLPPISLFQLRFASFMCEFSSFLMQLGFHQFPLYFRTFLLISVLISIKLENKY